MYTYTYTYIPIYIYIELFIESLPLYIIQSLALRHFASSCRITACSNDWILWRRAWRNGHQIPDRWSNKLDNGYIMVTWIIWIL